MDIIDVQSNRTESCFSGNVIVRRTRYPSSVADTEPAPEDEVELLVLDEVLELVLDDVLELVLDEVLELVLDEELELVPESVQTGGAKLPSCVP